MAPTATYLIKVLFDSDVDITKQIGNLPYLFMF